MVYDYAIIGAGAAGLQLALAMSKEDFFSDKKILILEADSKNTNDRTWCFWEKGASDYDNIITHKWDRALFYGGNESLDLNLGKYTYKMLRALDFYQYAKKEIAQHDCFDWKTETVNEISEKDVVQIKAENIYHADHVFDSRLTIDKKVLSSSTGVMQHFVGWEIETKASAFDTSAFTMMDYRLKWPESTSFTYVLPYEQNKALVEFTFFSNHDIQQDEYEDMIKEYISSILEIREYEVIASEKGVIPMVNYAFHQHNTERITKIGTAGGWVKASSGYSFKNAGNKCAKIIRNIKSGKRVSQNLFDKKYAVYDSTFLKVLQDENSLGEELFTIMYGKNNIETVLAFLDEETSFAQELKLMNTFPKAKFGKAMASILMK